MRLLKGFGLFALIVQILPVLILPLLMLPLGCARDAGLQNRQTPPLPSPKAQANATQPKASPLSSEAQANATEPQTPVSAAFPVTLTGADGARLVLKTAPSRIVSLAPSNTEILFDLGAGSAVAANTTADDWPPEVKQLPHIGGAFDMSLEKILAQNPDLIVADRTINAQIIAILKKAGLPVLVVQPTNVETSYDAIRLLGRATGKTVQAADMIHQLQQRFAAVRRSVEGAHKRPKVLVMYDVNKIYTSGPGTIIDDIITIAGGHNIARSNGPLVSEQVIQEQPDVILCDPSLQPEIAQLPAWSSTVPAVQNSAYFHPSPKATLIRPCLRLATGAEELAHSLHPEMFARDGNPIHVAAPPIAQGRSR